MRTTDGFKRVLFFVFLTGLIVSSAGSLFFASKVRERECYLDDLIRSTVDGNEGLSAEEIAIRLSRAIYEKTRHPLRVDQLDWYSLWESKSWFNVTTAVSLRYGGFGLKGHSSYGPCGTMSRVLLNALWKLDIPARKLQLLPNAEGKGGGHTMVEFLSGGRWVVISTSDGAFVWRNPDGSVATAEEIRKNREVFSQIYSRNPNYPYLFDRYANIRWEKLPGPVLVFFRGVLGRGRYESATTPRLYDKPRTLFLCISLAAVVFCAAMTHVFRFRSRATLRVIRRLHRS